MATLNELQAEVTRARAKLAAASEAQYRAAQDAALNGRAADLSAQRAAAAAARAQLDGAVAQLVAAGGPAELLAQVSSDVPHLLLPVRVEARYVTTRHVMRVRSLDDIVDVSSLPIASTVASIGFSDGAYEVPTLLRLPSHMHTSARAAALQIRSGHWPARRADRDELWIRIYPDTAFTDAFEPDLQPHEADAGRAFWTAVRGGEDAFTAWQRLVDSTSAPRAAWIVRALRPPGASGLQFPEVHLKDGPYTRAPVARLLPERFVVRLARGTAVREVIGRTVPEPLPLGLDPLASQDDQATTRVSNDGTTLQVPANLRWLHDLEAAEEVGLAIRVDLAEAPELREGVDSIVVLGVKLSASPEEAQRMLASHVENLVYKERGLAILPQGTPTNATNELGKRAAAEAEARLWFDAVWTPDGDASSDGNRLRRALGVPASTPVPGSSTGDIDEALLVNAALWPATLGYFLLQFLTPALGEDTRQRVRSFFTQYVSGRGLLPVVRFDRQPYGILPTTSIEHWRQGPGGDTERFLAQLWPHLMMLDAQWRALLPHVDAQIAAARASDRLDTPFLQLLGLAASSSRLDRDVLANADMRAALRGVQPSIAGFDATPRMLELARMRLSPTSYPTLVDSVSSIADRRQVRAPFVTAQPNERDELPRLPGKAWNYIDWVAGASFAKLWAGDFSEAPAGDGATDAPFDSVLARAARQAMLRTLVESGMHRLEPNPGLWLLRVRDFVIERLHDQPIAVQPQTLDTPLLQAYAPIIERFAITAPFTLDPDKQRALAPVAGQLASLPAVAELKAQLARMARIPTARLQRLFGEHLDLCSHRLDAWLLGVVSQRLERQRAARPTAIGIGAFGCLFAIERSPTPAIRIAEVTPELVPATAETFGTAAIPIGHLAHAASLGIDERHMFVYLGDAAASGAMLDGGVFRVAPGANARRGHGYLHAPSMDHAAAAAVMYAGHAAQGGNDPMLAIDLDSKRARAALGVLDKLQQGSSLGELLGVQLERALREHGLEPQLGDVRRAYPLRQSNEANRTHALAMTDGLAVLEAARRAPSAPLFTAIAPALAAITETLDAVSDLLLAESVFQSAKGKPERAAAALRTLHAGGQVVEPEVVQTPTTGRPVHHRVAIVFERGEPPATSPRAALAPDCNGWLARQLPDLDRVFVTIAMPDGTTSRHRLAALGLQPLDLIAATPENIAALFAMRTQGHADLASRRGFANDELTFAEIRPQLDAARRLLAQSRPLALSDLGEPGDTAPARVDTSRLTAILTKLAASTGALATIEAELRAPDATEAVLVRAWLHGLEDALGPSPDRGALADELARRRAAGEAALGSIPTDDDMARFERLAQIAALLLGPSARVFPEVAIEAPFARAYDDRASLANAGHSTVDRWLHEASLARDHVRTYRQLVLLREAFAAQHAALAPTVLQLPAGNGAARPWIGGRFDAERDSGTVSIVLELPPAFAASGTATGLLVDEWSELVPSRVANTGVAFQVEQPDSEPPQVLLFAVSPVEGATWKWEHLAGAVDEAIRLAKRRLVTPALIERHGGALAHVVPALALPVAPGSTQIPTVELPS